jgi:hypothetical protein
MALAQIISGLDSKMGFWVKNLVSTLLAQMLPGLAVVFCDEVEGFILH